MKKIFSIFLIVACLVLLVACTKPVADPTDVPVTATTTTEATSTTPESDVMTYAQYVDAETETAVLVETYVQAKQSWWEDKATLYTQDRDGGYFIYNAACSQELYDKLVPGTKILVAGYKSEWSGEVEIIDATISIVEGADTYIAEPVDVTALLGTDEIVTKQNVFVKMSGLTVAASKNGEEDVAFLYKWDGSGTDGDDLYFNVTYAGTTYTFTVESYLCDKSTAVYEAVKNLTIGDEISLEGFLYWYEGAQPHVTSVVVDSAFVPTDAPEASTAD